MRARAGLLKAPPSQLLYVGAWPASLFVCVLNSSEQVAEMEALALSYLGSGYDVCGQYANPVSIKPKIFDLERVPKKYIRQLSNKNTNFFSVVGETVEEYQSRLSLNAGISGSYGGLFSASVKSSFDSSKLAIAESSFVSIELCMRYETWKLETKAAEYVDPDVLEDFKTRDGKWLIEHYGGGVVMGLDIGGRWVDNLVVSKLYESSTRKVSVAMEAAYGAIVSGEGGAEVSKTVKEEKSIASRKVTAIGGNPAYAPGNLEKWQASVEEHPTLMNFTQSDGIVLIWEVFPEYEDKLKKGFEAYLKDHALTISKKRIIEAQYIEGYQYSSEAGSGAKKHLALYKPPPDGTWKYGGVGGNNNRILVMKEVSTEYGALREPVDWQPVWNDKRSFRPKNYSCWLPVAPTGFVALGVFCRFGVSNQKPPTREEYEGLVVVHSSLVEPCELDITEVWNDHGTFAKNDLTLGQLPHMALWPSNTSDERAGILPTKYTLKSEYIRN